MLRAEITFSRSEIEHLAAVLAEMLVMGADPSTVFTISVDPTQVRTVDTEKIVVITR